MELAGRSLKNQLSHASSLGARFVAVLSADGALLKDTQGAEQQSIAPGAVVHAVLRGHHAL